MVRLVWRFIGSFGKHAALFSSRPHFNVQIHASNSRDFVDKPQNPFRNFESDINSSHVFARREPHTDVWNISHSK